MPNYLFAYHGGEASAEDSDFEVIMKAWNDWITGLDDAVVDSGNPCGPSFTIACDGTLSEGGGGNPVTGYGIFKADSLDAAAKMARACPILDAGGSVELAEIFDVG